MPLKRIKSTVRRTFSGTGLKKGFADKDLVDAVKKQIATEESNTR